MDWKRVIHADRPSLEIRTVMRLADTDVVELMGILVEAAAGRWAFQGAEPHYPMFS
jgi:hypothetical protein